MARRITPPCAIKTASASLLATASSRSGNRPRIGGIAFHIHDLGARRRHRIGEGILGDIAVSGLRRQHRELAMAIGAA